MPARALLARAELNEGAAYLSSSARSSTKLVLYWYYSLIGSSGGRGVLSVPSAHFIACAYAAHSPVAVLLPSFRTPHMPSDW